MGLMVSYTVNLAGQHTELNAEHMVQFTTANLVDTYGFSVSLEVTQVKSTSVEISWNGVPYPEDKYVNIYRSFNFVVTSTVSLLEPYMFLL